MRHNIQENTHVPLCARLTKYVEVWVGHIFRSGYCRQKEKLPYLLKGQNVFVEHKDEPCGPNVSSDVPEISVRSHGTSITSVQSNEDFFGQNMHYRGLDLNCFCVGCTFSFLLLKSHKLYITLEPLSL